LYGTGALDEAEVTLHRAAVAAEAQRDDALLADAWTLLGRIVGTKRGLLAPGEPWCACAGAAIERLGGDDRHEAAPLRTRALLAQPGRMQSTRTSTPRNRLCSPPATAAPCATPSRPRCASSAAPPRRSSRIAARSPPPSGSCMSTSRR